MHIDPVELAFFLLIAIVIYFVCKKEGFNPIFWIFMGGWIGEEIFSRLPSANESGISDEERQRRKKRANIIGGALTIIGILLWIYFSFFFHPHRGD